MNQNENYWSGLLFVWIVATFVAWLCIAKKPYETERQFSQYIAFILFPVLLILFPIWYYMHRERLRWYRKKWFIMSLSQLQKQLIELPKIKK